MKKSNLPTLVIIISILLLFGFAYYQFLRSTNNRWVETYYNDDKEPYGGYVISEVIHNYFNTKPVILIKKPLRYVLDTNAVNSNYIFIGGYQISDYADQRHLLSFVCNGNNAFIAANEFDLTLLTYLLNPIDTLPDYTTLYNDSTWAFDENSQNADSIIQPFVDSNFATSAVDSIDSLIFDDQQTYDSTYLAQLDSSLQKNGQLDSANNSSEELVKYHTDSVVEINFTHPSFKKKYNFNYAYINKHDSIEYGWQYFDTSNINKSSIGCTSLGFIKNDKINFITIKYGKGMFYLHANPIVFANYNLLSEKKINYAELTLSHLPNTQTYYDEYSKKYNGSNNAFNNSESPMKYIFSQPELKWAYYLVVALLLLFILFRAKRKQKIIPVLKSNTNTSLEYVQTIGHLYFQTGEHKKIALQKMKVFLAFVRSRYRIQTQYLDAGFSQQLSLKSRIPIVSVNEIIERYKFLENLSTADEQILTDFYQSIENFYKNCA
jgi:hypothetical protein